MLGLLQASALVALGSGVPVSLALAAIYPMVRARLVRLPPVDRAGVLLSLSIAPVGIGLAAVALCFLPSVGAVLGVGTDHCLWHPDHHVHLCLVHRPALQYGAIGWITAGAMGALLVRLAYRLRDIVRSSTAIASLLRLARYDGERGVYVVDSEQPVSFAAGVYRPAICVSSRMFQVVSDRFMTVVLDHEREHVRRRDPMRLQVASLLTLAHVPGLARTLLCDLSLACEQACDEAAAAGSRDRLEVASAILAVERLFRKSRNQLELAFSSFGGGNVTARVEGLLTERPRHRRTPRWMWLFGSLGIATLLNADHLHHMAETLLGHVLP